MHQHTDLLIALAGQPNSGKSSLFQALTGIHQEIGNHAGITVEKKSAHYHDGQRRIEVVDLPGMYSLSSTTPEERVASDFILLERPEVIVAVVDAANLRRHLQLLLQLLEMQYPVVVCLNMADVARRRNVFVDAQKLSAALRVPVVETVASEGTGIEDLKAAIRQVASEYNHQSTNWSMSYGEQLELWLSELAAELTDRPHLMEDFYPRWLAIKLMESDRFARRIIQHHTHDDNWEEILRFYEHLLEDFTKEYGQTPLQCMLQARWKLAAKIDRDCSVYKPRPGGILSDRLDAYACHPVWGIIIAVIVLLGTFQLTFQFSDGWNWIPVGDSWATPVGALDHLIKEQIPNLIVHCFTPRGEAPNLEAFRNTPFGSLVLDGILAGVGGVLVFLPVIFSMFLFLGILELSGYISRVSLVMDRVLRQFGLCGQSILPLVLGGGIVGGCVVPAVYATRSLDNPRQKLLTMLVLPFMNCGGKTPVFLLLTATFFSAWKGLVFAALIFFAWFFVLTMAWILDKFLFRKEELPLLLELPPYQVPGIRSVLEKTLYQTGEFLYNVGTIILIANVFIWAAMYFPAVDNPKLSPLEASYAGQAGSALTPITQYAGFDEKDNIALFSGLASKEIIVSTLSIAYQLEAPEKTTDSVPSENPARPASSGSSAALTQRLQQSSDWTLPKIWAFMVFVMLYSPCVGTLTVIGRESGSWKWSVFAFVFNTAFALCVAILIYQIGSLVWN